MTYDFVDERSIQQCESADDEECYLFFFWFSK